MKKLLAGMLAIMLLCMATLALATETEDTAENQLPMLYEVEPIEDTIGFQPGTEITIASSTEMAGYFSTDMWGNNTADMDVRAILHGYSTVAWIRTLGMALDGTLVTDVLITELANGGRIYTFTLNRSLVYNDGSAITAKDYVFSLLLSSAPQIQEIGGMPRSLDHIAGYADYKSGAANVLSGLRLIDDHTFSMEIAPAYLPYFYGLEMLNVTPYPMAVIAPGCDIQDDGNGAYITGPFTAELLQKTLLDPVTGYVFNPRVTSGPYQLDTYDAENHVATFKVNPNYLGNFEGQKPHIEKITFMAAKNTDMAHLAADETVDVVNKVLDQQTFLDLTVLVQNGTLGRAQNYTRSGFAYIAFACEDGPTASANVRNAISLCIDKQAFVDNTFVEGTALPVYAYYGLGQWMISETITLDGEEVSVNEAMETLYEPRDIEGAKALLIADGWVLNADGNAFEEGTDTVRYRETSEGLEPLLIKWAKIKDNATANAIEKTIKEPFAQLGIGLEITEMLLSDMLPYFYRQEARTYNMFNLASNFTYVFDPYYDFNTADEYQGMVNASGLKDEKLMTLAWNLRKTEVRDVESYMTKWWAFQERWIELMPMVPLYSNVYFDFVAKDVQGYSIENFSSWASAILYTYIGDAPVDEEPLF